MNIFKFNISLSVAAILAGSVALTSCSADEPFAGSDGEGVLKMKMVINSDVTRAEMDADYETSLRSNCVVYISDPNRGLLFKYKGIETLPESLNLKNGSYVAEAWTGDSVSASFDKKFFRGYEPFSIQGGVNQVVLNCKIANVVASINKVTVDAIPVKDLKVTIGNSRASLDFNEENFDYAKGYYMMPNGETALSYTITGVNAEGKAFTKTGEITDVKRAHEYILNFSYNPEYEDLGGSFITVTIDDTEVVVEDEVEILGRPDVSLVDADIDKQVVGNAGAFDNLIMKVSAFGGIKSLLISSPQASSIGLPVADGNEFDFMNLTGSAADAITAAGITHDYKYSEKSNLATDFVVFTKEFLNKIPEADSEYVINVRVIDTYGKSAEKQIRLAIGEGAIVIEDPLVIGDLSTLSLLDLRSTSAVIPVQVVDATAANPAVRFREAGTAEWNVVNLSALTAAKAKKATRKAPATVTVRLTGLKPSTRYELQTIADGFEPSESKYITTESVFTIPNASMEEWGTTSELQTNVIFPGAGNTRSFWDTGNHGAAIAKAVLTDKSVDMVHTGSYSARLESRFASVFGIGKFAAGNLFIGNYDKTAGTNGEITFGRQYDGSHPSYLRVFVNYRPAAGQKGKGALSGYIEEGKMDKAQIYIALTDSPVTVKTADQKTLFNPEGDYIIGYGQATLEENYGPDGQLMELKIPIEYREKAKTEKPLYLIVVCSASKYGDYFSGGVGSTLYLDDFELVYE